MEKWDQKRYRLLEIVLKMPKTASSYLFLVKRSSVTRLCFGRKILILIIYKEWDNYGWKMSFWPISDRKLNTPVKDWGKTYIAILNANFMRISKIASDFLHFEPFSQYGSFSVIQWFNKKVTIRYDSAPFSKFWHGELPIFGAKHTQDGWRYRVWCINLAW